MACNTLTLSESDMLRRGKYMRYALRHLGMSPEEALRITVWPTEDELAIIQECELALDLGELEAIAA